MILILSNPFDATTTEVCFWLDKYNGNYLVLSTDDLYKDFTFRLPNNISFSIFDKVNVIWNRRWVIDSLFNEEYSKDNLVNKGIKQNLHSEIQILDKYFWNQFDDKIWIDKFSSIYVNKLQMLKIAQLMGFNIPDTIITTKKTVLDDFIKQNKSVICKSISDNIIFDIDEYNYFYGYTNEINSDLLKQLPDSFFPSLFQEEIDKEIEVRTFVLFKHIYSMAIFSQADNQTAIDFRKYNNEKPNRTAPFKLPKDISDNILKFMKKTNLNSGSFDFILDKKGKFYFIEINPVGQFGMISKPCDYKLEKLFAKELIYYDQKNKRNN